MGLGVKVFLYLRCIIEYSSPNVKKVLGFCEMLKKLKLFARYILLDTKIQLFLGFVLSLVLILLLLALEKNNILVLKIKSDSLVHYLTIIATISGTIGAVIVGFFFFWFQSIETRKQNWYLAIKDEIEILREILWNLPEELKSISDHLFQCIRFLEERTIKTYPIMEEDWKPMDTLIKVVIPDQKKYYDFFMDYRLVSSLAKIEEYVNEINLLFIVGAIARVVLRSIKKLFYSLLIAVAFIFYLQLIKGVYILHPMAISLVMFCFLYFTCTSILEMLIHLQYFYKEAIYQADTGDLSEEENSEQKKRRVE